MSVFVCRCTVTWTQQEEAGRWVFEQKSSSHSWVVFSMNTSCLTVIITPRCSRGGWTARWTSTGPGITTRRALVALLESTGWVRTVMWLHETLCSLKQTNSDVTSCLCVFRPGESLPSDSEEKVWAAGRHGGLQWEQSVCSLLLVLHRPRVPRIQTACVWIHWWRSRSVTVSS